jgi:hypothetical protein
MSIIVIVILLYHRHKPVDRINLFGRERKSNMLPVRYKHRVLNKG